MSFDPVEISAYRIKSARRFRLKSLNQANRLSLDIIDELVNFDVTRWQQNRRPLTNAEVETLLDFQEFRITGIVKQLPQ